MGACLAASEVIKGDTREALATAENYRDFLSLALTAYGKGHASFSRRAGLSSRSFIGEVLRGKRRLSHGSLEKVCTGLRLPPDLRRLFRLLVALEEPDLVFTDFKGDLRGMILRQREIIAHKKTQKTNLIQSYATPIVFAALGPTGKSLGELQSLTGLSPREITEALDVLLAHSVIELRDQVFHALQINLDFGDLKGDINFRHAFNQSLEVLKIRCLDSVPSPDQLFFYMAFSIAASQMNDFKTALQNSVLECVERFQTEDGGKVCRLSLGYTV